MSNWLSFEYPLRIRESHLDTFGHMNNAAYLQVLEEARWEFISARGWGLQTIQEKRLGPVILSVTLDFKSEIRLRELVTIKTKVLSYDGKIGKLEQQIVGEDGRQCAIAMFTIGLFDLNSRKLVAPTPEWLSAIGVVSSV